MGPRSGRRLIGSLLIAALLVPQAVAAGKPEPTGSPGTPPVVLSGAAIVLPQAGTVYVSIESASASASSDFGIDQPSHQLLFANATNNVGAAGALGPFSAGTTLVFYIFTPSLGTTYDVNRSLPVTIDDGTRKYVWGIGLAYAVSGPSLEIYHADRLGSVRALTNASAATIATYRTDEFGIPTASTGSSTQPFGFTGEPRDGTSLSYLRARYYDPGLGRFISRDSWIGSLATSQSLDRYAYVGNNPTTYVDPSGECVQFLLASLIGGPAVVVGATISGACVVVGAVALAIAGGAAVGYVAYEIKEDLERPIYEYRPDPPDFDIETGPIGPRGPGPQIGWKLVAGTAVGIVVVVKSHVLQPPAREPR